MSKNLNNSLTSDEFTEFRLLLEELDCIPVGAVPPTLRKLILDEWYEISKQKDFPDPFTESFVTNLNIRLRERKKIEPLEDSFTLFEQ